ncbi:hypothetical protein HPB52_002168 [Rhipicephalus sanguineus]|uniref:Tick transposon n=1 Tax=Rhipicephalus sanguineus TaxID=34632 RepID=A0A9D4Q8L7_RHISA|nr:hypothetical protein HPB52_002168 [Rhipicephalus sanguineus]
MISVLPQTHGAPSIHILNVYCPPHLQRVTFAELFYRALQAAARQPLAAVRDFNAPSPHWGYHFEKPRLLVSHRSPTQRIPHATWENLEDTLGSDHFLLKIAFPTRKMRQMRQICGPACTTDWSAFRTKPFPLLSPAGLPGMGIIGLPYTAIVQPKNFHLHISPCSGSPPPPPLGGTP